jgi:type IV secretion system protein VirB10
MPGKRARRINNVPVFMVFTAIGLVLLILGWVAIGRVNTAKAEVAEQGGRSSAAYARDIAAAVGQAGVVGPKAPPKTETPAPQPQTPLSTPALPDKPGNAGKPEPAGLKTPEIPKPSEEARRVRERRARQFEAALDGPIKVQMEEVKNGTRPANEELARVERQLAMLGDQTGDSYVERLAAIKAIAEGGAAETDYSRRGDLSRMNQFGSVSGNWRNASAVEAPATRFIVRTGSVIPATLISGINSDLPGQIVGQVAQDVYDTPTGRHLLIPQGSRLVGEYSSQVQYGQSRVFAVWQRIVFPDGKALDLGAMPGSSGAGYSGFRDRVNNHYVRIFGSAIMMSAILAGVEMTQNQQTYTDGSNQQRMSDAMSESLGQVLGGVIGEMLQKNMSIAPTLEIRPGYRLNVMLVKDLEFAGSYAAFDYAGAGK